MLSILFAGIGAIIGGLITGWTGALIGILGGLFAADFMRKGSLRMDTDSGLAELRREVAELKLKVAALTERVNGSSSMPGSMPTAENVKPSAAEIALVPVAAVPHTEAAPKPIAALTAAAKNPVTQVAAKPAPEVQQIDLEIDVFNAKASGLSEKIKDWFLGGNTLVRVGAVVLFFGLAFLLKFAAEHAVLPIELRYLGTGLGALAMLGIGWYLRDRRSAYAMMLQGLGVAILYLVTFAAFRIHALLPGGMTFAILVAICLLSAALAVLQNSRSLAVTGICGGFLAPVLASTGEGSHVMLFSYYLLLNIGIVGIAWFKAWRPLNVLGFIFTFGIGTMWGVKQYRDEMFATTEPFLLLFFGLYLAITLLYARRRKDEISKIGATTIAGERVDYVDGILVFGVPLAAFGLQYMMVRDMPFGSALSALGLGLIYLPIAMLLYRRHEEDFRVLVESFLALGVIFATLAIPFALEAKWTSAAWAAEGAGIFWIGLRQRRPVARAFALLLQLGAGASLLYSFPTRMDKLLDAVHASPIAFVMGALFLAASGIVTAWLMNRYADRLRDGEKLLEPVVLVWGLLWWWLAGAHEIRRYLNDYALASHLLLAAATAQLLLLGGRLARWRNATTAALLLLPILILIGLVAHRQQPYPFINYGWVAWPLALLSMYLVLCRQEDGPLARVLEVSHALTLWMLTAIATWQTWWWFRELGAIGSAWQILGCAVPSFIVLGWMHWKSARNRWPVSKFPRAYSLGATPIAIGLWVWVIAANLHNNGSAAPLPYLPLMNPLDLATAGTLLALLVWARRTSVYANIAPQSARLATAVVLGLTTFYWLNGVLLRTIYRWADIPFIMHVMMNSTLVQSALSLFWALNALGLMLWATRRGMRSLWLVGGGLMALVVLKLFLIDLSRVGTVERIISFIGVGLLLLLLGYFSPVPPKQGETK